MKALSTKYASTEQILPSLHPRPTYRWGWLGSWWGGGGALEWLWCQWKTCAPKWYIYRLFFFVLRFFHIPTVYLGQLWTWIAQDHHHNYRNRDIAPTTNFWKNWTRLSSTAKNSENDCRFRENKLLVSAFWKDRHKQSQMRKTGTADPAVLRHCAHQESSRGPRKHCLHLVIKVSETDQTVTRMGEGSEN